MARAPDRATRGLGPLCRNTPPGPEAPCLSTRVSSCGAKLPQGTLLLCGLAHSGLEVPPAEGMPNLRTKAHLGDAGHGDGGPVARNSTTCLLVGYDGFATPRSDC